ncbi:hypothetical protein BGX21_004751 [Mortierella sp. AD011]|nr:hypothetical protein BGX20_000209 [Mortierella sp. AD010]KAF9400219.1 hypothetical protein BGX21_004751 [Mortierella sp. AD011]
MQELFHATHLLQNSTPNTLSCPTTQCASPLTIAAAAICKTGSPSLLADPTIPLSSSSLPATYSSFPHPSSLNFLFSRHEPLTFFNFDINPNTSVFSTTFLAAMILQIAAFYLFRHFVPQLSDKNPKSTRGLSWVLTLFSSLVLFTGTFTLSSNMEWNPVGGNMLTLLSLRNFPKESDIATMYSAYFISYLICDLGLGVIHYRKYLDPLSGWLHHLGYLCIISNAALQKNVSTFFAMGTPIEVSTIFLASGHIFPKLRSDLLFAIAFFTSRIVYPIVLLPELYLNVESRLCWKVAMMALLLHVHWFRKFVQQQIRYHHARKNAACGQSESQPSVPHVDSKKLNATVYECPTNQVSIVNIKSLTANIPKDEPLKKNAMSHMDEIVVNEVESNSRRNREQARALRRSACPSFDSSVDGDSEPIADVSVMETPETPVKTMKQLLEECEQEDFAYALPMHGIKGSSNKTFSPQALKRMMSSQGSGNAIAGGALRLSRASSMRDSKRRIALGSVKFEDPKAKVSATRPMPTMVETSTQQLEGDATVVFRQRSSRSSVAMSPVERDQGFDYDMGTVRAPRRVSVQA